MDILTTGFNDNLCFFLCELCMTLLKKNDSRRSPVSWVSGILAFSKQDLDLKEGPNHLEWQCFKDPENSQSEPNHLEES
jgi:hypothetical protein